MENSKSPSQYKSELIQKLSYLDKKSLEIVKKAIITAENAHKDVERLSGEPYIIHPMATACRLATVRLDAASIAAGLLHDTVEDTSLTISDIKRDFGREIASLVESVTKLENIRIKKGWFPFRKIGEKELPEFERQVETLRKMLVAMSKDIRVVLIKLADRVHNTETLEFLPEGKQERVAREVIEIYAPIAQRLGMGKWRGELEDGAFIAIMPDEYKGLQKLAVPQIKEREKYLGNFVKKLEKMLLQNNIKAKIDFRAKRWFSLYKKLQKYDQDINKVYDLIAVRIIVDGVENCYSTLGLIHGSWKPLVGRIKDYIALPKPNGYQSIHTTIFGDEGKIIEIQIRTKEMDYQAEYGVAAHWIYSGAKSSRPAKKSELKWIQDFYEAQKSLVDTQELFNSFKMDLFEDRIFIFTPDGDVKDLPKGATPIDFAYSVHSAIGNKCAGAKVNGRIAPIDQRLENGNIVEIITRKNAHPRLDWLDSVRTQEARSQIKHYLRNQIAK